MAARNLLAEDSSLTSVLDQLDLTRADLQQVATGTTIESDGRASDEDHQTVDGSSSDIGEESETVTQPSSDHSHLIQTTLTDMP
jgi:hypothetical protein